MPSTKVKGKTKLKVKTQPQKGGDNKPKKEIIKPKLGRGIGGILMTSVRLKVEKDKNEKNKQNKNG